jgi:hypothetical protein
MTMEMQIKMKKYSHGELSDVADGAPAKEKPSANILKKYSHGELSSAPETYGAKEKPSNDILKKYSQGELSKVADGK